MALVDAEVLATLVPGKESKAEELLEAEEYRTFWYSFGTGEGALDPNRASEKLSGALQAFADQIEIRRAHKFAEPVQLPAAEQASLIDSPISDTIASPSLISIPNQLPVRVQDIVNSFERTFYLGKGSGHREQPHTVYGSANSD